VSAAADLLQRLSDIGATVRPAGDKLVIRAGLRPVPADLVKRLRVGKADVLAALVSPALLRDAPWWHREFLVRKLGWLTGNRTVIEAEGLAFQQLVLEWHRQYGTRFAGWQCAGCGEPIGGLGSIDFQDGNRVHFDEERACLIRFGRHWRGTATQALIAMGLRPPTGRTFDD